jgi:hypothetical protein
MLPIFWFLGLPLSLSLSLQNNNNNKTKKGNLETGAIALGFGLLGFQLSFGFVRSF